MNEHLTGGALAAGIASLAANDELQALLVALLSLAIREAIYWWQHRRRPTVAKE